MPKSERNSKSEIRKSQFASRSGFGFLSDFDFRASDFGEGATFCNTSANKMSLPNLAAGQGQIWGWEFAMLSFPR
jgi:hypothetical protein